MEGWDRGRERRVGGGGVGGLDGLGERWIGPGGDIKEQRGGVLLEGTSVGYGGTDQGTINLQPYHIYTL